MTAKRFKNRLIKLVEPEFVSAIVLESELMERAKAYGYFDEVFHLAGKDHTESFLVFIYKVRP